LLGIHRINRWILGISGRPGRRKVAVKVVDIFGADTMTIMVVKV
jgi:hypothetical protein